MFSETKKQYVVGNVVIEQNPISFLEVLNCYEPLTQLFVSIGKIIPKDVLEIENKTERIEQLTQAVTANINVLVQEFIGVVPKSFVAKHLTVDGKPATVVQLDEIPADVGVLILADMVKMLVTENFTMAVETMSKTLKTLRP